MDRKNSITHESSFTRTAANNAKMGAYYTDTLHCKALSQFLEFPEDAKEFLILEPSIGDASAVKAAVQKQKGDNKLIFGVDINRKTVEGVRTDDCVETVLCADFLTGITISQNVFGLVFSNPPYANQDGFRTEHLFYDRFYPAMKKGAVLVYVIPYAVFSERSFFKKFFNRFDIRYVYRFHKEEYAKWHQVAILAYKRDSLYNITETELKQMLEVYDSEEKIPELPFEDFQGQKLKVPEGNLESLHVFAPIEFPVADCIRSMNSGSARESIENLNRTLDNRISTPLYTGSHISRPPIHPKKDSMFLLGVCGVGSGLCGNEADGNLHLQRGVVKTQITSEYKENLEDEEKQGNGVIVETKRASFSYNVIQSNGLITKLE